MATLQVKKTTDNSKAFVVAESTEGSGELTSEFVLEYLKRHGITHGILLDAVKQFAQKPSTTVPVLIATATAPVAGKDGEVIDLVSAANRPAQMESGAVDHRDLQFFVNVQKGTPIRRKIPQQPSCEGIDVFGAPIAAPLVVDPPIGNGPGTRVEKHNDCDLVIAAINGAVRLSDSGVISVVDEYEIRSDIDYETGNITFWGNLRVIGAVLSGFSVATRGDLVVEKICEGSMLTSEKNITLRAGASGAGKAVIKLRGDLAAKYLENVTVFCGGNVTVQQHVIGSSIVCKGSLEARSCVGGKCVVTSHLRCDQIGNDAETKTEIDLGGAFQLEKKAHESMRSIGELIRQIGDNQGEIFQFVAENLDEFGMLTPTQQRELAQMKQTRKELLKKVSRQQKQTESVQQFLQTLSKPRLDCKKIYPGVTIRYGEMMRVIEHPITSFSAWPSHDKIVFERNNKEKI